MNRRFVPVVAVLALLLLAALVVHLFSRPADRHYGTVRDCSQSGGVWIPGARGESVCAR